ncbi:hypothetical protein ACFWGI_30190 [Streptomyces niveus]|uniref:hypothetical protein n=1 Tax=Streptomyces niveus TaxID=193462 RepID=UPI0036555430
MFTGMRLAVAGSHKGDAGISLIDQHLARHPRTSEVLADRGYSYCTPARWAHPVRARRLEPVIDLHPNQRGTHPRPNDGTVIIDGTLFTEAIPHPLRDLPGFPIGMRTEEKAKLRGRYDQRAAYAFTPHSRPDTDGYQRVPWLSACTASTRRPGQTVVRDSRTARRSRLSSPEWASRFAVTAMLSRVNSSPRWRAAWT